MRCSLSIPLPSNIMTQIENCLALEYDRIGLIAEHVGVIQTWRGLVCVLMD